MEASALVWREVGEVVGCTYSRDLVSMAASPLCSHPSSGKGTGQSIESGTHLR